MKEKITKRILSWWWKLTLKDCDIVWYDDLVDMETGERGIKVYHRQDSIRESYRGNEDLGIKTMPRREAESIGGRSCEDCFVNIRPKKK